MDVGEARPPGPAASARAARSRARDPPAARAGPGPRAPRSRATHHRALRARPPRGGRASSTSARIARAGTGAWCSTREANTTSAPPAPLLRRAARTSGPSISPRTSVTLPSSRRRTRSAARASWASERSSAITRSKTGREHLEQRAVAGAHVDREAAVREERREAPRGTPRAPRAGPTRSGLPAAREELARRLVARARGPRRPERGCRRRGRRRGRPRPRRRRPASSAAPRREAEQRPRPLPARGEEPRVAQRRGVPRDLGLALAQQLGELAHAELLDRGEGEEARAHRVGEQAVELPPRARVPEGRAGARGRARRLDVFQQRHERRYMRSCT